MGKKSREKRERREIGEIKPKKERSETSFVSLCKKTILIGTLLILFTPLIVDGNFYFPFVGPKSIYFMGLVLIIFTAYLLLVSLEPKYRPKLNILLIAITLFMVVSTISSVLGENFSYSFWSKYERMTGLLMQFHLFAFFIVLSSVFKKKQEWFKIFGVSIFVALLMSAISLFLKVDINLIGVLGPVSMGGAMIGNSSFMGTYLLLNIFLALYLFLKTRDNLRIYSAVSLIILFSALLVSDARAAILSLFGGLTLLFLFWLIFCHKTKLRLLGASLLAIFTISAGSLIYLIFQPGSFIHEKLVQIGLGARIITWQGAWQGLLERPWFGWGLENFELAFARHFNPLLFLPRYGGEIWFDRAHNIIVDTLITIGIIGFLAYLGIFIACFYLLTKKYFHPVKSRALNRVEYSGAEQFNRVKTKEFWTAGIFSTLLIAHFVQNFTVFDMVSSYMMFFLVLGFIASISLEKREEAIVLPVKTAQKNLNPFIAIIVLAFFGFSFFHFVIQPFRAGHYVIEALRAPHSSPQRIAFYKKTLETSPLGREQVRIFFAQAAINFSRTEAVEQIEPEVLKSKFGFLSQELEKNIKESPLDLRSHITLGNLYSVYARINPEKLVRAEEVLKQAIELSPLNPQAYWLLTQVKLYQRDFETALSLAKQAVELEPRINRAHFVLVQVAMAKGDIELARKKVDEAIKINPAWEATLKQLLPN